MGRWWCSKVSSIEVSPSSSCETDRAAAVGAAHLAVRQHQRAVAEVLLRQQQHPLAHRVAGVLDGAAGHPRLPRGGRRARGADLGVCGHDDDARDAELGAGDLAFDGDEALTDLRGCSMYLYLRFSSND